MCLTFVGYDARRLEKSDQAYMRLGSALGADLFLSDDRYGGHSAPQRDYHQEDRKYAMAIYVDPLVA